MSSYLKLWRAAAEAYDNFGLWLVSWVVFSIVMSLAVFGAQAASRWRIKLHPAVATLIIYAAWTILGKVILDLVWSVDDLFFRAALHNLEPTELFLQRRYAMVSCVQLAFLAIAGTCVLTALLVMSTVARGTGKSTPPKTEGV